MFGGPAPYIQVESTGGGGCGATPGGIKVVDRTIKSHPLETSMERESSKRAEGV